MGNQEWDPDQWKENLLKWIIHVVCVLLLMILVTLVYVAIFEIMVSLTEINSEMELQLKKGTF